MKAILILDMPSCCTDCNLERPGIEGTRFCVCEEKPITCDIDNKPDWCPLRPLPEKRDTPALNTVYDWHDNGWNACIKAITGN